MFSKKKAYKHVICYRCKDETKIPKRKNYLICFFKIDKCLHSLCNWHPSMQQRKRLMSLLTKFKNVFSRIFVNNKKMFRLLFWRRFSWSSGFISQKHRLFLGPFCKTNVSIGYSEASWKLRISQFLLQCF